MIRVLIIDDNIHYAKYIVNYIANKSKNIQVGYIATDGIEALKILESEKFDLILLDLKMPNCNGIEFIEAISINCLEARPKIMIISGDMDLIKKIPNSSMIDSIANKNDSIESIYKKVKQIENDIFYSKNEESIKNEIINELSLLGFNFKYKGIQYILQSILFIYSENNLMLLNNLENNVYKVLACKEKTSLNNVKTNITKSANLAYLCQEKKVIDNYFRFEIKPTPKIIISTILSKLISSENDSYI